MGSFSSHGSTEESTSLRSKRPSRSASPGAQTKRLKAASNSCRGGDAAQPSAAASVPPALAAPLVAFATPVAATAPVVGAPLGTVYASPFVPAADPEADWICEMCMRKFNSQETLQRHENQSELHKQNLAKFKALERTLQKSMAPSASSEVLAPQSLPSRTASPLPPPPPDSALCSVPPPPPPPDSTLAAATAEAVATHALVQCARDSERQRWLLCHGRTYVVGNPTGDADFRVHQTSVSRRHFSLQLDGPEPMVIITDLGSTNGTVVNGQKLACGLLKPRSSTKVQGGLARPFMFPAFAENLIRLGHCQDDFKVVKLPRL